jgi:protease I
MFDGQKPISAIGRGPKVLLSARILQGRTVTGGPEVRDDLIEAGIWYHDQPVVVDDNLLTCRGTEDLPDWGEAWVGLLENGT